MWKVFLFAATVLVATTLPAQQDVGSALTAAPKPGHPLDPRDVAALTGRADQRAENAPGGYAAWPVAYDGAWGFSDTLDSRTTLFAPVTTRVQPPFSRLLLPRFGRRSLLRFSTHRVRLPLGVARCAFFR